MAVAQTSSAHRSISWSAAKACMVALRRASAVGRVDLTPVSLRAVTFDCWNTLIRGADERAARARRVDVLRRAALLAGAPCDEATIERVYEECWQEHSRLWVAGITTGSIECARYSLRALGVDSREREAELE